jgi:hypothetical protein
MQAIEFETQIENGVIAIPAEYQQTFVDHTSVKVILLKPEVEDNSPDMIADLLAHPLEIDNLIPQSRDELHDR